MTDLNFGPEWLRALSDGNNVKSPPPSPAGFTKYKLADYRYGREEMLALYVPKKEVPEELAKHPSIVVEQSQPLLAVIPLTEEENRLMSQSVNSSAVLRLMGRGGPPPGVRGGRGGGPSDRGRGRGRGRGEGYFQRGTSFEDGAGYDTYGRGRAHNRSESWEDGRPGFTPRTFDDPDESPRREFSRSMSSSNWRDAKTLSERESPRDPRDIRDPRDPRDAEEDGDSWRRAGGTRHERSWGRGGGTSWRDRDRGDADYERPRGFERTRNNSYGDRGFRRSGEDLPEWSMDDGGDMDNLGGFDASGAFMSLEELEAKEKKTKPNDEGGKSKAGIKLQSKQPPEANHDSKEVNKENKEKSVSKSPEKDKEEQQQQQQEESTNKNNKNKNSGPTKTDKLKKPVSKSDIAKQEKISVSPTPEIAKDNINKDKEPVGKTKKTTNKKVQNKIEEKSVDTETCDRVAPQDVQPVVNESSKSNGIVPGEGISKDGGANDDVDQNISMSEADFHHLEEAAENLVATWTAEEDEKSDKKAQIENGAVPLAHEDAKKWFYKDPQQDLQGPFTSDEMAEWFSAGYFTMNLLIKRGCDERFQPLGELIKRWNRVPFLPGPPPPPLLNNPNTEADSKDQPDPVQQQQQQPQQQTAPTSVAAPSGPTPSAVTPDQVRALQQQYLMQQQLIQQQALMRQLQMQALLQQLGQQEAFAKLNPQQQQQLALQLLLKQQTGLLPQAAQQTPQNNTGKPQPQKVSPRSVDHPGLQRSVSQPADPDHPAFQRSLSQPSLEENNANNWQNPPTSGAAWSQPNSVWDLNPTKSQNTEEMRRLERDKAQKEEEERQENARRQEEERRRLEEAQRQEAERQHLIEQQKQEERRKLEEERIRQEREEEMRRIELQRQQQQQQEEMARKQEMQRQAEMQRRQEEQRQLEIQRRQVQEIQKAQELQRQQQQEALQRLQQEQLANIQLPTSAQWGKGVSPPAGSQALSLAQIQKLQEEKERNEQEERQRQIDIQRQQLQAIVQAQQQKSWAAAQAQANSGKSLLEIQEEQARQLQADHQRKQQQQQAQANKAQMSIAAAATWNSGANAATWASEGAWGANKANAGGFWEVSNSSQQQKNNTGKTGFPSLQSLSNSSNGPVNTSNKSKGPSRSKKEEEMVQRLFQARSPPQDDFTQWCHNALKGLNASVDIPTFVAFLQDVDSPYEVHDYVKSYLGETGDTQAFATAFLEKRSQCRNQERNQSEENMWGPAPAVNPNEGRQTQNNNDDKAVKNKKKKSKMQKLDPSILGFSVHAAPDRVNVGEIDTLEGVQ
ncbi:unnamed protein product [Owenia fusiformis]|uniref:Uncharacterized protein n=1 Tax=Owenia fusiformis TaxID=6347 RepID=A0A8J1YAV8_OWEFU|nr:unnamed protein product [Owenia fusiformis]